MCGLLKSLMTKNIFAHKFIDIKLKKVIKNFKKKLIFVGERVGLEGNGGKGDKAKVKRSNILNKK